MRDQLQDPKRILSIQSHVVSGYVGNRAATFPLQVLGWDVDVINTVQFSNHAGYGRLGGTKTEPEQLQKLFDGLEDNSLMRPSRLLTGYVPGAPALKKVAELAKDLTARNGFIYLLDPVMGDDGRLYVDPDVVPVYRDVLLPMSTIITPNWFEVALLTGIKVESSQNLRDALRILHHQRGVPNVVISSVVLDDSELPSQVKTLHDQQTTDSIYTGESILCICSSTYGVSEIAEGNSTSRVHFIKVPRIQGYFSGVGDLFSALVLAHFNPPPIGSKTSSASHEVPQSTLLSQATTKAVNTTHSVLVATQRYVLSLPEEDRPPTDDEMDRLEKNRRSKRMRSRELRIIQSMDLIREGGGSVLGQMQEWENFWMADV